jgi:hypothetical protein
MLNVIMLIVVVLSVVAPFYIVNYEARFRVMTSDDHTYKNGYHFENCIDNLNK